MNDILLTFQLYPLSLIIVCSIFGLLVGSFLNVVIFRYPIMLFRQWETMAIEVLAERGFKLSKPKQPIDNQPEQFNLVVPRSACPQCEHKISAIENIPLVSYLILQGKCRGCKTKISFRYPMVELITGLLFAVCAWNFGYGWPLAFAMLVSAYFVAMSFIDIDHQILPDSMTLPLVWLGLILAYFNTYIHFSDALWGAIFGYLILWSIYWLFKLLTGKEGMGYGDFKLLAVIGAFVGWQKLGIVVLLSAGVGAILGGLLLLVQNKDSQTKIPFGPYLAVAGWIVFIWGDSILNYYLVSSGLK
jgi:leader peptidase (prepilin peptidase) / N-methyltransferase